MKRLTAALCLALALYPAAAMARPAGLHCPGGGTKLEGQGTHSASGLTLVVSGSTVTVTGPAGAEVQLCVKAGPGNTGTRTVTLDSSGRATFQSDVLNRGGKIADVSYTVVYKVYPKGSSEVITFGGRRTGGGEAVDDVLTAAFERERTPITGAHLGLLIAGAWAANAGLRKVVAGRRP